MPVWPLLLASCGVAAYWNWRAALLVALCVAGVRINLALGLQQPMVAHMVVYSLVAFVGVFFVDILGGAALVIVSILMGAAFFGLIPHRAEIIASEVVLVLGLIASGISGPTGGMLDRNTSSSSRCDAAARGVPSRSAIVDRQDN